MGYMKLKQKVELAAIISVMIFSSHLWAESYTSLDASVKMYQNRVEDKTHKLKELSEKKAAAKNESEMRATLDEMIVEAKSLKESFVKFQKEKKRLKYEFPAQGDETERRYKRFELETIEELNSLSNIDLRLKGLLNRIEKVYDKPPEKIAKERKIEEERNKSSQELKSKEKKEETKVLEDRPKLSY